MSVDTFLLQTLNGVSFAGLLFLLASGFTLTFGLMNIVNLAHGGFYLVGGYIGMTTALTTGSFWLGVLAGALAVGAIGAVVERGLLRQLRGQSTAEVLLTVGIVLVLGDLALAIWGGDPRTVPIPEYLSGATDLGFTVYPTFRLFVAVVAVIVGATLWFLDRRTRAGAIVRAGVDDREMIAALGININLVFTGMFVFGAFLAGFSGVMGGAFLGLVPGAEIEILLFAMVVVILGGLGSLPGAAVGAIIVGLADSFGRALIPELSFFTLFAPMAIVLFLRPQGLLGKRI
ncbi:MAG: branched-chain amino acid ABC transporter permease [Acidimicrobiia bacterium]|nr:branched-chain amino acid ABC transporter permease [Acidimicrobiia bacterium]